jgi:hypothetical protein
MLGLKQQQGWQASHWWLVLLQLITEPGCCQ